MLTNEQEIIYKEKEGESIKIKRLISEEIFCKLQNSYEKMLRIVLPSLATDDIITQPLSVSISQTFGVERPFPSGIGCSLYAFTYHFKLVSVGPTHGELIRSKSIILPFGDCVVRYRKNKAESLRLF